MIVFTPASTLPRTLVEQDLQVLGAVLGRQLRLRGTQEVGVRFVSEKEIQALNKLYRGKNRPTDVLSFESGSIPTGQGTMKKMDLGDLVLCPVYAQREARRRKIEAREEYLRLLAHGVLHLCGYDHATEEDELKMFALQERCVEKVTYGL